jgi:NADP-dependent 3-hydroxy acid dehydrogenase YdfG
MADDKPHCMIIGVGAGTGLALVRRFVAGGYRVSMIARSADRLKGFADEVEGSVGYPVDINDTDAYRETLRRMIADLGAPKMVIYNGSLATFAPYTELDPDKLARNFRVNTIGLLVAAQETAPAMVEAGDGSIVVTGNTSALRGVPAFIGFAPTKASQRILAESLARELGPQGVHVAYVVIDAAIDMPFARKRWPGKPDDYFAKPDDIAGEVFHVAHQPRSTRSFLVQIRPFGETW